MAPVRPVDFEDRLTLVEHLDELRTRIITVLIVLGVAFAVCMWQNNLLLDIANAPLPGDREPITFGVAEPFTTTLTVAAYAALIVTFPVLIYEAYAFVLPALSPRERKALLPFMLMAPFLFLAGIVFAYFVVMPAATDFLLNFNESEFNIEIRAKDYYGFVALTSIAVGVLFQIPIGILAVTRLGIFTPQQIAQNRRYAILIIAVLAMLLPGTDPVTMVISMVPLVILFEGSLLLARVLYRPEDAGADLETLADEGAAGGPPDGGSPPSPPAPPAQPA